ncbi:MAG: response regulator [Deltaproteobacteria bacterium]|nr:response regulator [Deltaproteobacteria bacterium]
MKSNGKRILLVEDDPDAVELTLIGFRECGIECGIAVALDGSEALDYLFSSGKFNGRRRGMPDLVLLDLNLPKVSGHEVLKRLKDDKRTEEVPIVIFSVSNEERDRDLAYRNRANSYIRKPVDFERYKEVLKGVADYWLSLNEPPPF